MSKCISRPVDYGEYYLSSRFLILYLENVHSHS